jgi:anti-sigma factor RsiW
MKPTPVSDLLPDDPRITAYALGELEADDREVVEAAMRRDPTLRRTMVEIRATVAQIEGALAHEAATTDDAGRDNVVEFPGAAREPAPVDRYRRSARPKLLRYPQIYYVVGGLAAACFAVIAVWRTPPSAVSRPTAGAVASGGSESRETVLIDMSALVGAEEIRTRGDRRDGAAARAARTDEGGRAKFRRRRRRGCSRCRPRTAAR